MNMRLLVVALAFGSAVSAHYSVALEPNTEANTEANTQTTVTQALKAESEGDLVTRDRLLTEAMNSDSYCATARWQLGWIRDKTGAWSTVDDSVKNAKSDARWSAYESQRLMTADTPAAQWELSMWCRQNGFLDQADAHARRTIDLAPEHELARNMLGYKRVAGEWVAPEQLAVLARREENIMRGFQRYGKELNAIAQGLHSRRSEDRAEAKSRLMAIKDPAAVELIEARLGSLSTPSALATIEWMTSMDVPDSTMALVRFALLHPAPDVERVAVQCVKDRPFHDYVPQVLQMLGSAISAYSVPVLAADGTLTGFRETYTQEKQGRNETLVVDTRMRYVSGNAEAAGRARPSRRELAPTDPFSRLEALARAGEQTSQNAEQLRLVNQQVQLRNQNIARFLSYVANREFSGDPAEMWKWWDYENETEQQSLKLSNVRYASSTMTVRNYNEALAPGITWNHECFCKGTPVITRQGPKPIETIRVGDMVLSRNVASGELSWKVVLQATRRPPKPVLQIDLDEEKLCCTGGHLFWVSGKGWTKASRLKPGDALHGASLPIVVMKITEVGEDMTYNLSVESNHNYFVGEQMVLSHDVTERAATHQKVPGLSVGL